MALADSIPRVKWLFEKRPRRARSAPPEGGITVASLRVKAAKAVFQGKFGKSGQS